MSDWAARSHVSGADESTMIVSAQQILLDEAAHLRSERRLLGRIVEVHPRSSCRRRAALSCLRIHMLQAQPAYANVKVRGKT